jgi:hypothetical protein
LLVSVILIFDGTRTPCFFRKPLGFFFARCNAFGLSPAAKNAACVVLLVAKRVSSLRADLRDLPDDLRIISSRHKRIEKAEGNNRGRGTASYCPLGPSSSQEKAETRIGSLAKHGRNLPQGRQFDAKFATMNGMDHPDSMTLPELMWLVKKVRDSENAPEDVRKEADLHFKNLVEIGPGVRENAIKFLRANPAYWT